MSVSGDYGIVNQIEFQGRSFAGASVSNYGVVQTGDVVYTKSPLNSNPYGIIKTNKGKPGIVSTLYAVYHPKENAFSDFIQVYFEQHARMNNYMHPLVNKGAKNDMKVSAENALKGPVCFPSRIEQESISAFFSVLDNIITLHQRQHFLHSTPDISLSVRLIHPFYTSSWEQRKLGEIGSVSMCRRIFKEQTSETGDIPFYKIGTFGADPDAFISRELFEEYKSKYPYPQKGDILISASGSIGRTVEFAGNNEYFQDSNIVWLNHDERLSNPFLKCFYSVVKWAGIEGSTIKRLYNDNILNTVICMPSVPEQKRIGLFFENLDNLITLHQRKGKAAVSGCSNDANNSKGVCCKARDFGYKCHKKDEPNRFDA